MESPETMSISEWSDLVHRLTEENNELRQKLLVFEQSENNKLPDSKEQTVKTCANCKKLYQCKDVRKHPDWRCGNYR